MMGIRKKMSVAAWIAVLTAGAAMCAAACAAPAAGQTETQGETRTAQTETPAAAYDQTTDEGAAYMFLEAMTNLIIDGRFQEYAEYSADPAEVPGYLLTSDAAETDLSEWDTSLGELSITERCESRCEIAGQDRTLYGVLLVGPIIGSESDGETGTEVFLARWVWTYQDEDGDWVTVLGDAQHRRPLEAAE